MEVTLSVTRNVPMQLETNEKSAHTALAVKACLLGGNSNTKCSMTFVNIPVAISALAGGGPKNGFAPRPDPKKRFRTETRIRWCFRHFSRIFGCLSARGYWNGILGHFGSFPAMEKRPKMKKTLYIARFCRVFGCQSIENTAKTSVLDWRYSKKRGVNYRMLDWKHYKNTVKSNVWKDLLPLWQKTCKLPSVWLETLEKHCQKQCFGRISYWNFLAWRAPRGETTLSPSHGPK